MGAGICRNVVQPAKQYIYIYIYVRGEEYCGNLFYNGRPPYSRKTNSDTTFRYLSAISENIKVYWYAFSLRKV